MNSPFVNKNHTYQARLSFADNTTTYTGARTFKYISSTDIDIETVNYFRGKTSKITTINALKKIETYFSFYCNLPGAKFKKPETAIPKCLYITNLIGKAQLMHYAHIKSNGKYSEYHGKKINSKRLGKEIGEESSWLLGLLMKWKVIKRTSPYVKHDKGKGQEGTSCRYVLLDTEEGFIEVFQKPEFDRNVFERIDKKILKDQVTMSTNQNISNYKLVLDRITIDRSRDIMNLMVPLTSFKTKRAFKSYSRRYYSSSTKNTDVDLVSLITKDFSNDRLYIKSTYTISRFVGAYEYINKSIDDIDKGIHNIKRPDNENRLFCTFTSLCRELRQMLRIDGIPLIELDIRNSQLLLATLLIKKWWLSKNNEIPDDVVEFKNLCEAGNGYNYFMDIMGIANEHRRSFKTDFFGAVFFNEVKDDSKLHKYARVFKEVFPSCYSAICDIKGGLGSETYNQFAIKLQRIEANIMLDNVTFDLINNGIPVINIFDSVMCKPQDEQKVKQKILEEFAKHGLTPTLNKSDYTILKDAKAVVNEILINDLDDLQRKKRHRKSVNHTGFEKVLRVCRQEGSYINSNGVTFSGNGKQLNITYPLDSSTSLSITQPMHRLKLYFKNCPNKINYISLNNAISQLDEKG